MTFSSRRPLVPLALALASVLAVGACTADSTAPAPEPSTADPTEGTVEEAPEETVDPLVVLASFYPLQYLVEQVGGDAVQVSSMTPPGIDPHDLELSPRQVREIGEADVVLYLSGFQHSVDDAIAAREPARVLDAAATPAVAAHMEPEDDHDEDEDDHADDDDHGHDDDHDHGDDPHFWLDPTLLAAVGQELAAALAEAAPEQAEGFTQRADALEADLRALDEEFAAGLAQCERRVVVAAHEAYGFIAERYDLEQVGVSGLDPEAEPSPARLREIRDVVTDHGVTTIFTETLVNPRVAETLAADLGITTAVLDPIENQNDEGTDYRGAMEQNLAALRDALGCA